MPATIPQAAQTPRTTPALTERARMVRCGVCWAEPGDPCGDARGDLPGLHLGRFARARRKGLLTAAEAAAVIEAAGPVFTSATVTGDGAQPACTGCDADGVPLHTGDRGHVEYEDSGTFTGPDGSGGLLVRIDSDSQVVSCARQQVRLLACGTPRGGAS